MNILKLAQEFLERSKADPKKNIQQAMSNAAQALSQLDIYEDQDLYRVVRQINGYLTTLWNSSGSYNFQDKLDSDLPDLKKMFQTAIALSKGPERNNLMTGFRLINSI